MMSLPMGVRTGALAAAALGMLAGTALAQDQTNYQTNIGSHNRGFYLGLGVGPNWQEDSRVRGGGADATADYDTGFAGLGSIGYATGWGWRFELEPGYRRNELGKIGGVSGHGHTTIETLMANAVYDVPIRVPGNLPYLRDMLPHVGLGAGVARVLDSSVPYNGLTVTGNDTAPAFQLIAGLDYAITPAITAGIDYRYLLVHDVDFHVAQTGANAKVGDINDHAVLLTFRYSFGAPSRPHVQPAAAAAVAAPPAMPASPPPPASRNYVVYFDLNRATLTPAGRDVVRQAATNAQQARVTRISVTGYTDTTGSRRYNQQLSDRRAKAVQAELVTNGVPTDEIVIAGRGETDLAVPTANGVDEPRNRRVVILEEAPGS